MVKQELPKHDHLNETEKLRRLAELFFLVHGSRLRDLDHALCVEYGEILDEYIDGNPKFNSYSENPEAKKAKVERYILKVAANDFQEPKAERGENPNVFEAPPWDRDA